MRCIVWRGNPADKQQSARGPVAIFDAGKTVVFIISQVSSRRAYVLRTLSNKAEEGQKVPGIFPHVSVLITAPKADKVTRLLRLISQLERWERPIETLSDDVLRRLNVMLEQRSFTVRQLRKVIEL